MKLNIGDQVKIVQGRNYIACTSRIGQQAEVTLIYPPLSHPAALYAIVTFADGGKRACYEDEMEVLSPGAS